MSKDEALRSILVELNIDNFGGRQHQSTPQMAVSLPPLCMMRLYSVHISLIRQLKEADYLSIIKISTETSIFTFLRHCIGILLVFMKSL